jgi:hypothetical protein
MAPLEYSIKWLTCAFVGRRDVVLVRALAKDAPDGLARCKLGRLTADG